MLRGQRLFEISDPIRADEMWVLNDRPSLRFVRDALTMRRAPTIDLVLLRLPEAEPVSQPAALASAASADAEETGGSHELPGLWPDVQLGTKECAQPALLWERMCTSTILAPVMPTGRGALRSSFSSALPEQGPEAVRHV